MSNDDKVFQHESYGMIGYSRTSHGGATTHLFGSAIDKHFSTIRIRIRTAERRHHLSMDWFHANDQIIDVELSAAQFAEFITTANMGDGVPCPIRAVNGRRMEDPPAELVEAAEVREGFTAQCKALGARLAKVSASVDSILTGSKFGKPEKDAIRGALAGIVQEVRANLPFVMDQFQEATGRVVTAAKAEADAFLTHAVARAGIKAIKSNGGVVQLGTGEEE